MAALAVACARGAAPGVDVSAPYLAAPPSADEAALYVTVVNTGSAVDSLLGVSTDLAATAMIHRDVPDGGLVRMVPVKALALPPGDTVRLAPGGTHLMLMHLRRVPKAGDTVTATLRFARAPAKTVRVPVLSYADIGRRVGRP